MECNTARKKLKDYVKGNITEAMEKNELEKHIQECPICKKELYMWQEVIDKQKVISNMQGNMSMNLRDRIKYRMIQSQKEAFLPPTIHKLRAISKIWSSTKGKLIIEALIILVALVVLFKYMHGGKGLLVPFLIIFGFIILFFIMIRGREKK